MAYNYPYGAYGAQEGSQVGGYPNYPPPNYPPPPAYYQNYPPGQAPPAMPHYHQQPPASGPNRPPPQQQQQQGPRPTGFNQSPKTNPENPRTDLVVWPDFVTRGTHTKLEFRRKRRMAALNNVYENDKKRFHITPKTYKRRKMHIKDGYTGVKICKIQLKASSHRVVEVKDMSGNLLLVTRCRKVLQFKKRFDVFLMNVNPGYENREPDLVVEGSVHKAKNFKIQTPNGRLLASLQRDKKKGMERFRGKTAYFMQVQPDTDCLLMTILLLIQDELFGKKQSTTTGGGGLTIGGDFGGGGGDCGGGGGDCGGC